MWLPSGGSLVIDRTEAMIVVDVNTGKFTGQGGNLEETVTRNNLEAAEEIVRQLRLRDLGGIIVIDFIDMVLESNRDLVLRRLLECLGRDRTKHQVAEVTSLGLVQMTRKRVGQGLLESFSETCVHCNGRGVIVHMEQAQPPSAAGAARRAAAAKAAERSTTVLTHGPTEAHGDGETEAEVAAEVAEPIALPEPAFVPDEELYSSAAEAEAAARGGRSRRRGGRKATRPPVRRGGAGGRGARGGGRRRRGRSGTPPCGGRRAAEPAVGAWPDGGAAPSEAPAESAVVEAAEVRGSGGGCCGAGGSGAGAASGDAEGDGSGGFAGGGVAEDAGAIVVPAAEESAVVEAAEVRGSGSEAAAEPVAPVGRASGDAEGDGSGGFAGGGVCRGRGGDRGSGGEESAVVEAAEVRGSGSEAVVEPVAPVRARRRATRKVTAPAGSPGEAVSDEGAIGFPRPNRLWVRSRTELTELTRLTARGPARRGRHPQGGQEGDRPEGGRRPVRRRRGRRGRRRGAGDGREHREEGREEVGGQEGRVDQAKQTAAADQPNPPSVSAQADDATGA